MNLKAIVYKVFKIKPKRKSLKQLIKEVEQEVYGHERA